ncbi:myosin light chain kinase, smooth muscle-like isoform X2 [Pyxicephalus adspersus]|uniref:myosin light chain kinase, smooth muscle-like isoform X2 n=1 Tax=Pyxicephalus adspersus TaxID=30357 RepID=UPI003B5A0557
MSYTSTLRIQIKNKQGASENDCGELHHMGKAKMVLPEESHHGMQCPANLPTNNKTEKVDLNVTGDTAANLRVVKTSDRYLTVFFELSPHSGGGLCVRRVDSPVPILSNASNANKRQVRKGPLPALLEFCPPDSSHQTPETEGVNTSSVVDREIKSPYWEKKEREGKRASPFVPASPHKKSSICPSQSASSDFKASYNSPTQDVVSPKRKPHRSGDSLKILNGISHLEVKKGGQAELRCVIKGTPPLAASWVRNKKPVIDGPRISIHTTDRESCLLIRDVSENDQGNYTLCVQDQTRSTQHQTTLTVVDRPSPPSGKPLISALSPSSLTLSWSGPCYDGGSAVLSYKVEVKKVGQNSWRLLTDTCANTSYNVNSGLVSGERYQFRVRACNAYGESDPGEETEIITMAYVADGETECEDTVEYTTVSINSTDRVDALYTRLEKLGVGKFGQVFKLQDKTTGKIRAGKFSKARTQKDLANARAEVELMNKLHHPQLVHLVAAFQEPGLMILVMEYIAGGELFERIVADDFDHTEITSVQYMSQIITGVGYMHKQSIVHLDLKPENIVCVSKVSTKVKIVDFGLARKLEPGVPVKVLHGTAEFVAPEVIAYEPVGFTTDMWSLGVICYILLCGDSPFQGDNDMETLRNITSGSWDFDEETDAILSDSAKDFIRRLLKKNMRSRLTAEQALDHPWIKDKNISSTKTLPKEGIRKFLARQKWQKTGKAVLALKRMALLSNKSDNNSPVMEEDGESQEVFSFLQEQLQRSPVFSSQLQDQSEVVGSTARFHCHIEGFPDPEVLWFFSGQPIQESNRFQIDYEDSGSCTLIISNVSPNDAGMYTCQASNVHGHAETSSRLIVHKLHAQRHTREGDEKTA